MTRSVLSLFEYSFSKCVEWTAALFNSIGAGGIVVAAFIIYLVVFLFLIPIRGGGLNRREFGDFVRSTTHKTKRSNGTRSNAD